MGELQLVEFVTLDGVMQGFGSPDEDRDGGFDLGGWGAAYATDPGQAEAAEEGMQSTVAYLFGRRTYEKMAQFWPFQPDDNTMAAHLNRTPKYVATRTLTELTWDGAQVLDGELGPAVQDLKASVDGEVVVLGSGELAQQLMALGLVDGYQLFLHPLLLGQGKRLFRTLPDPQRLKLLDATPTATGVVMLSYAVEH